MTGIPDETRYGASWEKGPMAGNIHRMLQVPEEEAAKARRDVCRVCAYWDKTSMSCDYYLMEGHFRPCAAIDCVKDGVFVRRGRGGNGTGTYWNIMRYRDYTSYGFAEEKCRECEKEGRNVKNDRDHKH